VVLRPEDAVTDEDVTGDHYARLAGTFDENWAYSPAFCEWMSGRIRQRLRITGTDRIADIGCGTGLYARGLAGYAESVVCVDRSAPMLAQIAPGDRLTPVTASVEDVASGRVPLPGPAGFDAILLKEVLHHVSDRGAVIAGLAGLLRPGGRMLVVMLPATISYPLFAAALDLFARQQPDPGDIAAQMRAAGLEAEVAYESFPLAFATGKYLEMVRDRYMSLLSHFGDAELEAGVAEIQDAHPGDEIAFDDTFAFVLGVRI
jgi:SAM-dependent methyltransferase